MFCVGFMSKLRQLNIRKIKQTCLFIQDQECSLKNLVRIHIFNGGDSIHANLLVSWKTNTFKTSLGVLKKDGGYVLVTGDEVPANAKLENLIAIVRAVEEYGKY
jgi:hypothetical protein